MVNAVAANLAAMRHPNALGGDVFNVGSGQRIRLLDLVASLNAISDNISNPTSSLCEPGTFAIRWRASCGSARFSGIGRSFHSMRGCDRRSRRVGRRSCLDRGCLLQGFPGGGEHLSVVRTVRRRHQVSRRFGQSRSLQGLYRRLPGR